MAREFKVNEVVKQGAVISVILADRNNPIIINLNNNMVCSYSGREVKNFPAGKYDISAIKDNIVYLKMFECMCNREANEICRLLRKVELFANNPELLENTSVCYLANECPKGFIQWLKNTGREPTENSLALYKENKIINNLKKEHKEMYDFLFSAPSPYTNINRIHKTYLNMSEELRTKFIKIFKVSMKKFSWNFTVDLENFIRTLFWGDTWTWHNMTVPKNWEELLNTDRDFMWNLKNIEAITKKELEKKMIENENKIREIEKLSNEEFTIIVPKTLQDFTKEGEMQHNCVGYFYHEDVAEGDALIYFIRHTNNPNVSYITNRYNTYCNETVESRKIFNQINDDKRARNLITEIDKLITSILSNE